MLLTLNIKNNSTLEKILYMLEEFTDEDVEIISLEIPEDAKSETYQKLEVLSKKIGNSKRIDSILIGISKDYVHNN